MREIDRLILAYAGRDCEFLAEVGSLSDHSGWRDGLDKVVGSSIEGNRRVDVGVRWESWLVLRHSNWFCISMANP